MGIEENKAVVERFDRLMGSDDLDELDELCTPDMVNHTLAPGRPAGLAGTREFLETMGRHQIVNLVWKTLTVVAEGDFVVQFGERAGEWKGGEFLGFEAEAGAYSQGFAIMYRLVDGRIAERWAIRDDLAVLRQLGALTP
ncbi:ester cyclase [Kribbella sp. NBC_01245]|uniref:ester cyclase n=1 Tax=Kribbella sp. NBC_01245 TaxID=2903578 RepID=UPI002E28A5B8|nr:ester cyclase [Kribbella sp. NBC_01245]